MGQRAVMVMAAVLVTGVSACSGPKGADAASGSDLKGVPASYAPPAVGSVAPAFAVRTLGGDTARIGGAARQPVTLVNVWATWCGPCKAEFPELQALHETYRSRGLRVLAISIDTDDDAAVLASAKSMGATFALGRDADDTVRGLFAAPGIPESWLFAADGRLLWRHSGAIPAGDPAVRAAIDSALSAAAGTQ